MPNPPFCKEHTGVLPIPRPSLEIGVIVERFAAKRGASPQVDGKKGIDRHRKRAISAKGMSGRHRRT